MYQNSKHTNECILAQEKYTHETKNPNFVRHGSCWRCNRSVYDDCEINGETSKGYSLETAGSMVITHCPHCRTSFID